MQLVVVFLCLALIAWCEADGTEYDNSLKPAVEKVVGSKAQRSIADIVSKATGKIGKTKSMQTPIPHAKPLQRKPSRLSNRFYVLYL